LKDPVRLELGYTRVMMGFLLLQPAPARISMLGLGGGSLAKYCYRHLPDSAMEAVEINPQVIALRDVFRIPHDDARFAVVCADGADYV
ncbi:spermidine synthase, partial [Achromobacter sp. SIMBA_011]